MPKHKQITRTKFQIPNIEKRIFVFGICGLEIICYLVLVVCNLAAG
jgi:t-SNARE complex subunit (syntaxin)